MTRRLGDVCLCRYSEVKGQNFPFEMEEGDAGEVWLRCPSVETGWLRPEDVAAEILKALLLTVSDGYEEEVDRCVLSVPAYFDDAQRQATIAAVTVMNWDRLGV